MAKKAKGAKKTGKLPKTIAGVKIDKTLRKTGEALIAKANSPRGRQAIAAGLALAASAAAARARPQRAAPAHPGEPGTEPRRGADGELDRIVDAASNATRAFLNGFLGRKG